MGYKIITLEKNSGSASKPRNIGIKLARGEYFMFVDSDDVLSPTALEEIYPQAKKYEADTLYCARYNVFHGETFKNSKIKPKGKEIKVELLTERIFSLKGFSGLPWLYLHRREFILQNNLKVPEMFFKGEGIIGEDIVFNFYVLFFSKRVLRVPNAVYYRRIILDSASRSHELIKHLKIWTGWTVGCIKFLQDFMNKFEVFQKNQDIKRQVFDRFVFGSVDRFANCLDVSLSEREEIISDRLEMLEDKNYLTTYLFSKLIDLRIDNLKKDVDLKKFQEDSQILNSDNKKLQTENQELQNKLQNLTEIISKALEKVENKTQLESFLQNNSIDSEESELKKLREENKKLKEKISTSYEKLQEELQKLTC